MQSNPQDKQLARDILEYWLKHPEAKETVTGIHCVWLKNWSNPDAVKQALDYLMQKEWVAVRVPPQPEEIYKLNQGNLQEMMNFLSEKSGGGVKDSALTTLGSEAANSAYKKKV